VVGPPGIGKSRLVEELRAKLLRKHFTILEAHCAAHTSGFAYHPIRALVRGVAAWGFRRRGAPGIGRAPRRMAKRALPASRPRCRRAFRRIGCALRRCSRPHSRQYGRSSHGPPERRRVVIVEDVHWADASSRAPRFLVDGMGRSPLPDRHLPPDSQPAFMGRPLATRIALAPLSRDESRTLVSAVIPPEKLAAPMVDDIVGRAEGNPLFLEEITLALGEGQTLSAIPDSIHGILRLRIERLAPPRRSFRFRRGERFPARCWVGLDGAGSWAARQADRADLLWPVGAPYVQTRPDPGRSLRGARRRRARGSTGTRAPSSHSIATAQARRASSSPTTTRRAPTVKRPSNS
jgi:hypothetical protein